MNSLHVCGKAKRGVHICMLDAGHSTPCFVDGHVIDEMLVTSKKKERSEWTIPLLMCGHVFSFVLFALVLISESEDVVEARRLVLMIGGLWAVAPLILLAAKKSNNVGSE